MPLAMISSGLSPLATIFELALAIFLFDWHSEREGLVYAIKFKDSSNEWSL